MNKSVSHTFADESIEAKAAWFRTLSVEERMNVLIEVTNLIFENNPEVVNKKHARPASDRIRVLSKE